MAEVEAARVAARARFARFADDDEVGKISGPVDPDNPPMTDAQLARLRPAAEVSPALVAASLRRGNGRSRPPEHVTPVLSEAEQSTRTESTDVVQVVEERLNVGKRAVSRGKMRLHSYVVSREVSEDVTLRDETVSIDRYTVDRPVTALSEDAFRERTIELEEFAEEAVVAKSIHVVEEIGFRKDVSDHVKTVHDTVRSTRIDIEDERASGAALASAKHPVVEIQEGMDIVGSDGILVGRVDLVEAERLGVNTDGQHHYLPRAIVDSVADRVTLSVTADEAGAQWATA